MVTKKFFKLFLSGIFIMGILCAWSIAPVLVQAENDVDYSEIPSLAVEVDGETLALKNSPKIISGRTMLPMRPVFESMGAEVEWDGDDKLIYGSTDDTRVVMSPEHGEAIINGDSEPLSTAPQIIDGRTYIPFRFTGEAFGGYVEYLGEQNKVKVILNEQDETDENEGTEGINDTNDFDGGDGIEETNGVDDTEESSSPSIPGPELPQLPELPEKP